MDCVIEGVETWEQCDLIARMGCRFAQGHYFAQALPGEQFRDFMGSMQSRRRYKPPGNLRLVQ